MRKLRLLILALIGLVGSLPALGISLYVSPEVPTTLSAVLRFPWDIVRYDSGVYSTTLSLPPPTAIDGLHRMDGGDWLLSVEAPRILGTIAADPRDVVRYDGLTFSFFFCGAAAGVPAGSNVDAVILLSSGDAGPLILSFDVPTVIGASTFEPSDLVMFKRTGVGCGSWGVSASLFFDGSTAAPPVPISTNVTAADSRPPRTILSFDVPTTLGPTFVPGNLVSYLPPFALFEPLATWPTSSIVNALTFPPDPGLVPPTILVTRLNPAGSLINVAWSKSCSVGAENYGIYEGAIGTWYSHTRVDCSDALGDLNEDIGTTSGNRYYLVTPRNDNDEGSYGTRSSGPERPVGTAQCVATQVLSPCP